MKYNESFVKFASQEVMDRPSYHVDHTPNHRFLVYFKTKGAPDGKTDPMGTKHPCDVQLFQRRILFLGKKKNSEMTQGDSGGGFVAGWGSKGHRYRLVAVFSHGDCGKR